jgi:diguanylate cyclase (GGDEF)-like protein
VKQVHTSIREVAVLQQATQMILSSLDLDTVLHHILLIVRNYFGASRCAVFLRDPAANDLYCRAQNGHDPEIMKQRVLIGNESIAGWVAFTRAPLYVPDLSQDSRYSARGAGGALALPLLVRDRILGVLDIASDQTDPFPAEAIGLLSVFAGQAAIALENARLHSTELRRVRQMELLNLIARSAALAHDTPQFFSTLVDLISDAFEGVEVAIVLTQSKGTLSVAAQSGGNNISEERFQMSAKSGVLQPVLAGKPCIVIDDSQAQPGWATCFPGSRSEMCVPMISFSEVMGAVVLAHREPGSFAPDDRFIAQAAADVCATAARSAQLTEELRRIANRDPLTGLYNQRYFHQVISQEIARSRRSTSGFALFLLDLRRMREVNALLGMEQGDQILQQVAARLRAGTRENDVVCRYMSDRYALVLPEVNESSASLVMAKLQSLLGAIEVEISGTRRRLAATWACVTFPADGQQEAALVKTLFDRLESSKRDHADAAGTA